MIKPKFTMAQFEKDLLRRMDSIDRKIITRLMLIGEQFVTDARSKAPDAYEVVVDGKKTMKHKPGPRMKTIRPDTPGFLDHSSNLRSSICYIVLKDGVKRSPGKIPKDSKEYIDKLIAKHRKGYVLIVATGMNYAAAVEAKGYDVITGSHFAATAALNKAFKKVG